MINAIFILIQTSENPDPTSKIVIGVFFLFWLTYVDWLSLIRGEQTWNNTFKYYIPLFTSNKHSKGSRIILELCRISFFVISYLFVYVIAPSEGLTVAKDLELYILMIGISFWSSWFFGEILYRDPIFKKKDSFSILKLFLGYLFGILISICILRSPASFKNNQSHFSMTKSEIASEQRKDIKNLVIAVVVILAIIIYLNREQYFG